MFKEAAYEAANEKLREELRRYDAEILYADAQLGIIRQRLASQGIDGETVVVVTSDHGEAFGEHGPFDRQHGYSVFDNQLRVPLIVHAPSASAAGYRCDSQVGLIDVLPSLLEIAGLSAVEGVQGRSFAPALDGRAIEARPVVSGWGYRAWSSLRDPPWKLAVNPDFGVARLLNVIEDPGETRFLEREDKARVMAMRAELTRRLAEGERLRARFPADDRSFALSASQRRQLEHLGYIEE